MEWIAEYRKSLKMIEVEETLDLVFYRPLAFGFVKLIYNTSLTPNQISYLALTIGVIGGALFSQGTYAASVIAATLLIIYDVLDCSDGQLARMKKNGTLTGRIIDGFSDYIVTVAAYIGIGIGLSLQTGDPVYAWALTAAAGISNAIHAISLDYYRNQFMDNTLARESTLGENLERFKAEYQNHKSEKGSLFETLLIYLYLKYSALQIRFAPDNTVRFNGKEYYASNKRILHFWTYLGPTTELSFMIVCALFNRLDMYLWGILLVGNLYLVILYMWQQRINRTLTVIESA